MLNKLLNPIERCNLKFNEVGGLDGTTNGLIEGYASTFGTVDGAGDTVLPGAFAESLENRSTPVRMFYQHDRSQVIGKWLEIREDDVGLFVVGELTPGHTLANDVYASLKHGAIDGLSIGFRPAKDGMKKIAGGGRILGKVDLVEISAVTLPANTEATILNVKSDIESIDSLRECEKFLRDAGFSRSMAKAFISQCRPLYQREADREQERKEALSADRKWLHNLIEEIKS